MTLPGTPLKKRHYAKIPELVQEAEQVLSEADMQYRCASISLLEEYFRLPTYPRLVPSADGALKAVALNLPAYAVRGELNPLWKTFSDLIQKLPTYTFLHIFTHQAVEGVLKSWLERQQLKSRAQVYTIPDHVEMTIWTEDAYVAVHDADNQLFMIQQHTYRRPGDELASYHVAKKAGWMKAKVPLYFEGGNILVGDNFYFIGANYVVDTFFDLGELFVQHKNMHAKKELIQLYQQYLDKGRTVYFIGITLQLPVEQVRSFKLNGEVWQEKVYLKNKAGSVQPMFHIDMFITLAGRSESGKYQVLVGDTRVAAELLGNDYDLLATPEAFDEVAEQLTRLSFEVIRNPLPLIYVDDEEEKVRKWYYATYNNALVEIKSQQDKTVWLPSYGHGNWRELKRTDEVNKLIWQQLGFKVVMLEDFHPFAEFFGSVHCIKKYIEREKIE